MVLPRDVRQREVEKFVEDAEGNVAVRTLIKAGDLQIGAVEIKDHDSETRANVGANGLEVDVKASALPTGAATSANQTDGSQQAKIKEVNPKDATKVNESAVLAYDANLNLSTITKTISGTAYVKTLTYDANGNLSTISAWV